MHWGYAIFLVPANKQKVCCIIINCTIKPMVVVYTWRISDWHENQTPFINWNWLFQCMIPAETQKLQMNGLMTYHPLRIDQSLTLFISSEQTLLATSKNLLNYLCFHSCMMHIFLWAFLISCTILAMKVQSLNSSSLQCHTVHKAHVHMSLQQCMRLLHNFTYVARGNVITNMHGTQYLVFMGEERQKLWTQKYCFKGRTIYPGGKCSFNFPATRNLHLHQFNAALNVPGIVTDTVHENLEFNNFKRQKYL